MLDEKSDKAVPMAKPKKLEVASRAGEIALATLREFATLFPMLHLREAAGVALVIVQTVQAMKDNEDAFKRLGQDTADVVYGVCMINVGKDDLDLTPAMTSNIEHLKRTVDNIKIFVDAQLKRKPWMRLVFSRADVGKLQEHRENLNQAMSMFGLRTSIGIHETVMRLAESQDQLLREFRERIDKHDHATPARNTSATTADYKTQSTHAVGVSTSAPATVTHIQGDHTVTTSNNTTTNTDSGNTTTTIISDSYNDDSVRHSSRQSARRR